MKITDMPGSHSEAGDVHFMIVEAGGETFWRASERLLSGYGRNRLEAVIDLARVQEREQLAAYHAADI